MLTYGISCSWIGKRRPSGLSSGSIGSRLLRRVCPSHLSCSSLEILTAPQRLSVLLSCCHAAGLWEQSDEVKGLHRRLLVSNIMSERQAQIAHSRIVEHAAKLEGARFVQKQQQALEVRSPVQEILAALLLQCKMFLSSGSSACGVVLRRQHRRQHN